MNKKDAVKLKPGAWAEIKWDEGPNSVGLVVSRASPRLSGALLVQMLIMPDFDPRFVAHTSIVRTLGQLEVPSLSGEASITVRGYYQVKDTSESYAAVRRIVRAIKGIRHLDRIFFLAVRETTCAGDDYIVIPFINSPRDDSEHPEYGVVVSWPEYVEDQFLFDHLEPVGRRVVRVPESIDPQLYISTFEVLNGLSWPRTRKERQVAKLAAVRKAFDGILEFDHQ